MPLPNEDTTPPVTNTKRVINVSQDFPSLKKKRCREGKHDGTVGYHRMVSALRLFHGFFQRRRPRRLASGVACTVSSSNRSATAMSWAAVGVTEYSSGRRDRSAAGT